MTGASGTKFSIQFNGVWKMVDSPTLTLTPAYQWLGQILYGDQTEDAIYRLIDLNGDGDAADAGEHDVFFDASNASGLVDPSTNIFNIHQASDGSAYAGDGSTDTVYRLRDLNGDGDANDADEANVWFSAANLEGHPLVTPNGIAEGSDGAIYLVNAGVTSTPQDAIYRTVDLNGDGDANDYGESTVWLDLQTVNATSSAFDISFIGDVAYLTDTNGGAPDTVYRIQDLNGDGDAADEGEATVFLSDAESYGAPIDIANTAQGNSILTYTWIPNDEEPSRIYRLTDLDNSGSIDSPDEATEIWNHEFLPEGFDTAFGFSIAAGRNGDVIITSNSSDPASSNVVRLSDLNNDGDYMDAGESVIALSNFFDETTANRPRAVAYYEDGTTLPGGLTHVEGGRAVKFAADLTIADGDSSVLSGATVAIVGGLNVADLISVKRGGAPVDVEYDPQTGVLTIEGEASVAVYQEILQSLAFQTRSDDPSEAVRNIEITVFDERGEAGASVSVATTVGVAAERSVTHVFGTDETESIKGTNSDDGIFGYSGNDILRGLRGDDILSGGIGNDTLRAGGGDDQLFGGKGNDALFGFGGDDDLFGGKGRDDLRGGRGDDVLSGGAGKDFLSGGGGKDKFVFAADSQRDVVLDFEVGVDRIAFDGVTLDGKAVKGLGQAEAAAESVGSGVKFTFDDGAILMLRDIELGDLYA